MPVSPTIKRVAVACQFVSRHLTFRTHTNCLHVSASDKLVATSHENGWYYERGDGADWAEGDEVRLIDEEGNAFLWNGQTRKYIEEGFIDGLVRDSVIYNNLYLPLNDPDTVDRYIQKIKQYAEQNNEAKTQEYKGKLNKYLEENGDLKAFLVPDGTIPLLDETLLEDHNLESAVKEDYRTHVKTTEQKVVMDSWIETQIRAKLVFLKSVTDDTDFQDGLERMVNILNELPVSLTDEVRSENTWYETTNQGDEIFEWLDKNKDSIEMNHYDTAMKLVNKGSFQKAIDLMVEPVKTAYKNTGYDGRDTVNDADVTYAIKKYLGLG